MAETATTPEATPDATPAPSETPPPTPKVWETPIGDDAPSVFKPFAGKPLAHLGEEFGQMRRTLTQRSEALKAKDASITELQQQLEAAKSQPPPDPGVEPLSPAETQAGLQKFLETGEIDADFAKEAAERGFRADGQTLADLMRSVKDRSDAFMQSITDDLKGHEWGDIKQWLESGTTPYSPTQLEAMNEAVAGGDAMWIPSIVDKYQQALNSGDFQPGRNAKGQFMRHPEGRPAPSNADIYPTRHAALQASTAAHADRENHAGMAEHLAKMQRSEQYFSQRGEAWPEGP